ncbi:MAG: hypothetical protein KDK04_00315 [Candidatus Competibacteraceae bacterium]|nr:hypothetical protein [Candidatus Competibacteraceae bacterium]MCB1803746.1 hypothetical protein [Candidatus Competibacteraceae bacterium]MCB1810157.1 hypothetical protein [Candidatus Competibacteraceae bacterium]
MTCYQKITCPTYNPDIKTSGRNAQGVQRYRCWNPACASQTFMLGRYKANEPGVKTQAVEMALNGSGIRDTARVLKINKGTVISALKKKRADS